MKSFSQFSEELITELSKKTLGSYIKKARDDYGNHAGTNAVESSKPESKMNVKSMIRQKNSFDKGVKRSLGIDKAIDKLVKEDQLGNSMSILSKYINQAMAGKKNSTTTPNSTDTIMKSTKPAKVIGSDDKQNDAKIK